MGRFPKWLRYGFPSVCFCLGTWQVYRLHSKQQLLSELERGLGRAAIKIHTLPLDAEGIRHRRLKLYGIPKLVKPIFVGPRCARDIDVDFAMNFILPYRLVDGHTVMVDYGRVPIGQESQIKISEEDYVEVMLDESEKKSIGMTQNDPLTGKWLYKDINAMAKQLDCEPLLFRRISRKRNDQCLPIPVPPRINISNRHMEYIITWYVMAASTFALGFLKR